MLYLTGSDDKKLKSANLIISESSFSHNARGGIYLGGADSGNIQIKSSAVRDSPENGLETAFSHVNSFTLFNCAFIRNQIGIKLSSFSGKVIIENTKVSNSTHNALYVDSNGEKTIQIENSSVTHSNGYGLYLDGSYMRVNLLASKSYFAWNKATSVYSRAYYSGCYSPCVSQASFKNCTFFMNQGPVVNIYESSQWTPWEFEGNIFMNNTQGSVIMTTQVTDYRYTPGVFVRKNKFLFNFCQEKGVIYINGGSKDLIIEGNVFEENYGRSIYIAERSVSGATIKSNDFKDNRCLNKGVIEVTRMEDDIVIVDNVFKFNQGLFMVLLHCEYVVKGQRNTVIKKLNFTNNSLVNNTEVSSSFPPCEVSISGLTEYKRISIKYNRFNSSRFSKELCVNTLASSHRSILSAPLNFWGRDNEAQIKQRIFDAENNYEHTLAGILPFLNSAGDYMQNIHVDDTFDVPAERYLGGRISSNVQLRKYHSPFIVMSDITILPEASLTVDPGVEVKFKPEVGMLVLGSLFVRGARNQPVTFSQWRKSQTGISLPVRLVEGKFPWQGRVGVLHKGNWIPVCLNETATFGTNNAKVVCEQLGYQAPLSISHFLKAFTSEWTLCAVLRCDGNEADVKECSLSFRNLSSNSSYHVALNCSEGAPWGNIRFVREVTNTSHQPASNLQHLKIEHCGKKHGQKVAAIEMIQYVPDVNHVTILNCTAGGIKVWFPEKEVHLQNNSFMNTGGDGAEILITEQNVTLESIRTVKNKYGLSFGEPNGDWMPGLSYGQVHLCALETMVNIKDSDAFLYFRKPVMTYSNPQVSCHMRVQTEGDAGLAVQLLVMKNVQYIGINDPNDETVLKFSTKDLGPLSRRVIPWNAFTVYFYGWYTSEVLLRVQRVENKG